MTDEKSKNRTVYLNDEEYAACKHAAVNVKLNFSKWASLVLIDNALVRIGVIAGGICGFRPGECSNTDAWRFLKTGKIYVCEECFSKTEVPKDYFEDRRPKMTVNEQRAVLVDAVMRACDALRAYEAAVGRQSSTVEAPRPIYMQRLPSSRSSVSEVASLFDTSPAIDED